MKGGKEVWSTKKAGGLPAIASLFRWGKRRKDKQPNGMLDLANVMAGIGILGIDGKGAIVFCSTRMLQILEDAVGRPLAHRKVVNQPLEDILGLFLSRSIIGHSLTWREELSGRRIKIGDRNLLASTLLLWNSDKQAPLGCIGYYIPYVPEANGECAEAAQYVVERLAMERGYPATSWISTISLEHAMQLQQCLVKNTHLIPNPRHCAFATQCAFNSVYGCFSLERRRFYRVPIIIPVRAFIEAKDGKTIDEPLASKFCEGQTVDLSLGGVCVRSALRFPIGVSLRLEFLLAIPFECQGQIVWNGRAENGQWEHGIRFLSLGKEERAVVLRLLSSRTPAKAPKDLSSSDQGSFSTDDTVLKQAIALLLRFLQAKDRNTFAHSMRTAHIAKLLGEALGLLDRELQSLEYAAALHDLGKLELEPGLLQSSATLRQEQIERLRAHSTYGARLLESYRPLRFLTAIVRHHHEWFDGEGYPDGLVGENIPFLSRIIAVADSIDAMAYPRPYRQTPLTKDQILRVLDRQAGRQFDPEIARVAIKLISAGTLTLDIGPGELGSDDFAPWLQESSEKK